MENRKWIVDKMRRLWDFLFLGHRSSLSLSLFRIAIALTVGFHVIPSFFHLEDNYLSKAFKETNLSFFTPGVIHWVQQSPDWLVYFFVSFFLLYWFFFLIGLYSQVSGILMMIGCYYFYALNSFHIGTLSWDILLVTLFLMCVTGYHGDYFSVDALRQGNRFVYKKKRPYFIQRLLQMQIAFNFFYTGLYKVTAQGNWLTDNPLYYLWNYPPEGVTKQFLFREFFASRPDLCYWMGVGIVVMELSAPLLLFWRRTRFFAIGMGFFFNILLITTLHVPTIFFFLFPSQLLLFINPDDILGWIKKGRKGNLAGGQSPHPHCFVLQSKTVGALRQAKPWGQSQIIYDGKCHFCQWSVQKLLTMDLFGTLKKVDYHDHDDLSKLHPSLNKEICHSQLHLIESGGKIYGGFFIFRRLCLRLPMLYPLIPIVYFPGSGIMGPSVYRWVAKNRYLLHFSGRCKDNACLR